MPGTTAQVRNPQLVDILGADFIRRNDANFVRSALRAESAIGATSVSISAPFERGLANGFWVVIDAFTNDAELRFINSVSNAYHTVGFTDTLAYAHGIGDTVILLVEPTLNVKWFGAKGDGATDDATAISRAVAQAIKASNNNRVIYFPGGEYLVGSTIAIGGYGVRFVGQHDRRPVSVSNETGASKLNFTGTGELIEIGTDSGNPYDNAEYDGFHGFEMFDMALEYTGGSSTALRNGRPGGYGTGTYGIRDWRGGSVRLVRVWMERFEYGFWGIQSDFNYFQDFWPRYCHRGMYLGPRTDQFTGIHISTLYNDTALVCDRIEGARFFACQWIHDGSNLDWPLDIGSSFTSRGCEGIYFYGNWFEHGSDSYDGVNAFVRIGYIAGSDDNQQSEFIKFRDSHFITGTGAPNIDYFIRLGNANYVEIDGVSGRTANLTDLIEAVGAAASRNVLARGPGAVLSTLDMVVSGGTTPGFIRWQWAARDLYTEVWTDYSATSTITGWTTFTTKKIYYKKIGRLVHVVFDIAGTSNSTSTSFTLPDNNADVIARILMVVTDNGAAQAGNAAMAVGANTVACRVGYGTAGGSWTNSGTKQVQGILVYRAE